MKLRRLRRSFEISKRKDLVIETAHNGLITLYVVHKYGFLRPNTTSVQVASFTPAELMKVFHVTMSMLSAVLPEDVIFSITPTSDKEGDLGRDSTTDN